MVIVQRQGTTSWEGFAKNSGRNLTETSPSKQPTIAEQKSNAMRSSTSSSTTGRTSRGARGTGPLSSSAVMTRKGTMSNTFWEDAGHNSVENMSEFYKEMDAMKMVDVNDDDEDNIVEKDDSSGKTDPMTDDSFLNSSSHHTAASSSKGRISRSERISTNSAPDWKSTSLPSLPAPPPVHSAEFKEAGKEAGENENGGSSSKRSQSDNWVQNMAQSALHKLEESQRGQKVVQAQKPSSISKRSQSEGAAAAASATPNWVEKGFTAFKNWNNKK